MARRMLENARRHIQAQPDTIPIGGVYYPYSQWDNKHNPIFELHHSTRPLLDTQVLALLQDDRIRRLKKPEESFERALEPIRDHLDSWKMGMVSDARLSCENPGLSNASAESLLHTSQGAREMRQSMSMEGHREGGG